MQIIQDPKENFPPNKKCIETLDDMLEYGAVRGKI